MAAVSLAVVSAVFIAGCTNNATPAPVGSSSTPTVTASPTAPMSPLVTPETEPNTGTPSAGSSTAPVPSASIDATSTSPQQPVYVEAPEVVVMDQALQLEEINLSTRIGRPIVLLTMAPKDWEVVSMSPEGIVEYKAGKKKGNAVLNPSLTAVSLGETTVVMRHKDGSTVTFNIVTTDKA